MKTGTKVMGWVTVAVLALSAGAAVAKPAVKKEVSGVVNLNTATLQQLDLLPGIGEKAARRIIEHRQKTPFTKVEDLRKVKGFGAKKFEKLKPFISVSGPTTVSLKKVMPGADGKAPGSGSSPPAQGRKPGGR